MDKQLTSVCSDYFQGTAAGLHNSGFFFFKAKAVFTAGTDKSCNKEGSKVRWTESVPAARFPSSRLEPNSGVEKENVICPWPCQQPHEPGQWPRFLSQLAAAEPEDTGQTQHWAGQMALGSAGKDRTYHTPLKALPACFTELCSIRAI